MAVAEKSDPRVLVILHQHCSSPGRIGRILCDLGYRLDIRRPRFDDPLPKTLADHAGVVVFGGPMSANDDEDWICREIDWIGVPLKEGKPFLGICLGAQMLARHLGHRVCPHPQGRVEVGYYPIDPTEHGHELCDRPFPDRVYQWHREGFDLPSGATLLASGQDFEAQAFRYGPEAFGFQFHPEVTLPMICRWSARSRERLNFPGARPLHRHLEGWLRHDRAISRWSTAFLRSWIEGAQTARPPQIFVPGQAGPDAAAMS
ncbi:glutamine amidotransferase [Methylocella silvestris]|uniref:Glutamine amidotransferase n=1 Tax=Methylocella silvestris TaxID=199596 RepID=A0A2J7TIU8_METSI|nr:glutamine amidotransferase [Methylocella silvestris]PNG26688.1 glutamine amidotransferase [Methylocella silvestris]